MAKKAKAPAIVAELGRPETPAETAARKARDSKLYRERKTVNNLVFSLIVSLGLMVAIVLMAPGLIGGKDYLQDASVDVAQLAKQSTDAAGRTLAAPKAPAAWRAKAANLREKDGLITWEIHYTVVEKGLDDSYAGVVQASTPAGKPATEKFVQSRLEGLTPTGTAEFAGHEWQEYSYPTRSPSSNNVRYAYATTVAGQTLLVFGTAEQKYIKQLATATIDSLQSSK